jgi:hypothetical protein
VGVAGVVIIAAIAGALGLLIVGIVMWSTRATLTAMRAEANRTRTLQLLQLFGPAIAAAADDPRALLLWHPIASTARRLFPEESQSLDEAAGARFPFGPAQLHAAHARWTSDWLAWEAAHDAEYKLRAAALENELGSACNTPLGRARLDALQREKLERYQRRYEDYTRVSKGLRELVESKN